MPLEFYITATVTLFVIIDPIGTTPIFMAMTQGASRARRRAIAIRACLIGMAILLLFGLLGEELLDFVGISMPAFRIAGGILLFLTALEMLFGRRTQRRRDQSDSDVPEVADDPSVFPLAIPLLAGPGSITSIILLTDQAAGDPLTTGGVFAVMVAIFLLVFLMFLMAGPIERVLGDTGILVVTRLLGMLLSALSVQFVLDGLGAVGFG